MRVRSKRWVHRAIALSAALSVPMLQQQFAHAGNTGSVFNDATDLSNGNNYTPNIADPTNAPTIDVQLSGSYTATTLDINGAALSFGTLNDLDATQPLVLSNTSATAGSITLNSPMNSTTGSALADLLYVASGGNLSLQNGAGTLTLNLADSGNIDNLGTLSLASPISVTNSSALTFTGSGTTTAAGIISGATGGIFINAPGGTVAFNGANTYTGGTTISAGTLSINNANSLGALTSGLTLDGGTLKTTAGVTVGARVVTIGANGGAFDVHGGQLYFNTNGTLTGSGPLTITGAGGLAGNVRVNANQSTYTGAITLNAGGGLEFNTAAAFTSTNVFNVNGTGNGAQATSGELTVSNGITIGNTINVDGGILSADNGATAVFGGPIILGAAGVQLATRDFYSTATTGQSFTISGVISGVGGVTKANFAGTTALTGANTFTGATSIEGGVLSIKTIADDGASTPNSLGETSGANSVISISTGATLQYTGSTLGSSNRPISLATPAGGTFGLDASGSIPFALSGAITPAGTSGTFTLNFTGTGVGAEIASLVDGPGSSVNAVTRSGGIGGVWILSGNNTYSGATNINGGAIEYPNTTGSVSPSSAITVNSGGTLAVAVDGPGGFSSSGSGAGTVSGVFAGLVGSSGTVTYNSGANVGLDTTNVAGGTMTYRPDVSNVGVTKIGTGTLILTGALTAPAGVTVDGGTLVLTGNNSLTGVSNVFKGVLQLQANSGNTTGGLTSALTSSTAAGRLNLNNGAALQLRADSTAPGNITFQGTNGIGALNNATVNIDVDQISGAGGNVFTIAATGATAVGNAVTLNITGNNSDSLAIGTLDSVTGTATNLTLNPTTTTVSVGGYFNYNNGTNSSTMTLSGASGGNTVVGPILNQGAGSTGTTGKVSVNKIGASTWTLSGANTYTGTTTFNNGTLIFAGDATLPAGTTVQPEGGTLSIRYDGTGSGQTLTTNQNTPFNFLANNVTSTIDVGNNGSANTGNTIVLGAFNIPNNYANTIKFTGSNGYLVQIASLGLPGATGQTTTLIPTSTSVIISGKVTNNGTGGNGNFDTLVLDGTSAGNEIDGAISDAGNAVAHTARYTPVVKQNSSTWTLRGQNTYTGATTFKAGTLVFSGDGTLPTGSTIQPQGGAISLLNDGAGSNQTITTNQANPWNFTGNASSTINVANNGGSNVNNTISLGAFTVTGAYANTINFTGSNGYLVKIASLALPLTNGNATTLVPTTTSVTIAGNVTNQDNGTGSSYDTLVLDGTSAGNLIQGVISDGTGSNYVAGATDFTRVFKQNASTWTLTGANTYTGITTVSGGTLALGSGGKFGDSNVTVNAGATLAVVPGVNGSNNSIGSGGSLTLNNGASFTMADGATSTFTTAAATLSTGAGAATSLTFDLGGSDGISSDLLTISGAITQSNSAHPTLITVDGVGNIAPAGGTQYTIITAVNSDLVNANFTLGNPGARVVIGGTAYIADLSASNASSEIITLTQPAVSAVSAYYTGNGSAGAGGTSLNDTAGGGTVTNFSTNPAGTTDLGGQPDVAQDVYFTASNVTTPRTLSSLGQSYTWNSLNFTSTAPSITINDDTNTLTINNGITNNSPNNQAVNVGVTLAATQTITNNGAGLLTLGGAVTAGANLITFAGAGATTLSGSGFSTSAGVTVNTGAGPVTISAPTTVGGTSAFTNNSANTLTFGTMAAGANAITVAGAGDTTIGGNLTSTNTVTKTGSGTLTLGGAANSMKELIISTDSIVDIGSGQLSLNDSGGGTLYTSSGGTVNGTGGGSLVISTNSGANFGDNGAAAGKTLTINAIITGPNGFEVYGGGGVVVLTAANTFKGDVNVDGGILSVSNIGLKGTGDTTSNLGEGSNIYLSQNTKGTLLYTGNGEVTDRVINLNGTTTGGVLDQSGHGTLEFSADFAKPAAGIKTLVLQGSTDGIGQLDGAIIDNSATNTTAVTKSGTGTWVLAGASTYSGGTTLTQNGGALQVTNASALGTGAVTNATTNGATSGSTLQLNFTVPASGAGSSAANPNVIANAFNFFSQNRLDANGFSDLENLAGFNQITGALTISNTGGNGANVTSDGGNLEIAGPVSVSNALPAGSRIFDFGGAGNGLISGVVSDAPAGANAVLSSLQKDGTGTWSLSAPNTYSGGTQLNAGILLVTNTSGSGAGAGPVNVAGAATLGGTGIISGANAIVTVGGTITAGSGPSRTSVPGLLTTSGGADTGSVGAANASQIWNGGGSYAWKVNPAVNPNGQTATVTNGVGTTDPGTAGDHVPGTNWDTLAMSTLSIQATSSSSPFTINIVPTTASTFTTSDPYTIADITTGYVTIGNGAATNYASNSAALTTALQTLQADRLLVLNVPPLLGHSSDYTLSAISDGGTGNDIVISYSAAPEPTSLLMLGIGAGALLLRRRRNTRADGPAGSSEA